MNQPTPKDEEDKPNQLELEERMKVNYSNKNNISIKKIIARCWKDLLHPWTSYAVFALHLLRIIFISEVKFELELHAKNFLNPNVCSAHLLFLSSFFSANRTAQGCKGSTEMQKGTEQMWSFWWEEKLYSLQISEVSEDWDDHRSDAGKKCYTLYDLLVYLHW